MDETAQVLPNLSDFSEMLKQSFRAQHPEAGEFDAELIEVKTLTVNENQENFSLLFRAPGDYPGKQGIYELSAAGREPFSIFLVPVSKDGGGLYLEAVFNNFVKK